MIPLNYAGKQVFMFTTIGGRVKQADRKAAKFARVGKLAARWPTIESKLIRLLERGSREAFTCLLMAETGIRIGNEDSAAGYVAQIKGKEGEFVQTFGITTLKPEHVEVKGNQLLLGFIGKKAVEQRLSVKNKLLVKWGKRFLDSASDTWLGLDEYDIRKFIKKRVDSRVTIKDFRSLCANCHAYIFYDQKISGRELPSTKTELNAEIKEVLVATSLVLGNTPSVCKTAYLAPGLWDFIEAERGGIIHQRAAERLQRKVEREIKWKAMNSERVSNGLPAKRKKRRRRTSAG